MMKSKGFLMIESMVALIIALTGVTAFSLIVASGRKNEQIIENKTDRAYAWRILKEHDATEIIVHDHVYQLETGNKIYDKNAQKSYEVKK